LEAVCGIPAGLLDEKVYIDADGNSTGDPVKISIQVRPSGLDDCQFIILEEIGYRQDEEIIPGGEVGVEDGDVFCRGLFESQL
jgi:hypothetical protein